MATAGPGLEWTLKWGDSTQAVQYTPVVPASTEGEVSAVTTANSVFLGVVQDDPKENEPARIQTNGVTRVQYKGTISYGDRLALIADGVETATTPSTAVIVGIALVHGSSGDVGTMLILRGTGV